MAVDLSIIIVTFNHDREIQLCLSTLRKILASLRVEIILVDNASTDDTVTNARTLLQSSGESLDWFILANSRNEGFTRGVNQGLNRSRGRFILLLNPDTEFPMPIFRELISALDDDAALGMVSPQFRNPDGTIQPSCRQFPRRRDVFYAAIGLSCLFPKSSEFNYWKMGDFNHQSRRDVDQPQGAFLLAKAKAVAQIGKLDESFPMFFSDVDWCRRFAAQQWKIQFIPDVHIIHYKGTSIHRNRLRMIWSSHRSFVTYFKKYDHSFRERTATLVTGGLLYLLAGLRSLFTIVHHWLRKPRP
ncbi:MAG: glycosyltransferase family 2 protein [Candidatus Zhuqueibacterota bacterium]